MMDNFTVQFTDSSDEYIELKRQANVLLSTRRGSIPLARDFGIDWDVLSEPVNDIPTDLAVQCMEQFETYIPELKVVSVKCEEASDQGYVKPVITLERNQSNG